MLAISSDEYMRQEDLPLLLPESGLKALPGLSSFKLSLGPHLTSIEDSLVLAMPHLSKLDLSQNLLTHLPHALASLTGLQTLNVARNKGLKLCTNCIEVPAYN